MIDWFTVATGLAAALRVTGPWHSGCGCTFGSRGERSPSAGCVIDLALTAYDEAPARWGRAMTGAMTDEDALDAVWPNWRNPIHPHFVSRCERTPEQAIQEMRREADRERHADGGGGWSVRHGTFMRLTGR